MRRFPREWMFLWSNVQFQGLDGRSSVSGPQFLEERIQMRKGTLIALGAMIGCAGVVTAQEEPVLTPRKHRAIEMEPTRVAPVLGRNADGSFIIGQWQPYDADGAITGEDPQGRILDAYEGADGVCGEPGLLFPANGPLSGGVEPVCDFDAGLTGDCMDGDTQRWFWGATATFGSQIAEITSFADEAGDVADRITFGWNVANVQGDEPCGVTFNDPFVFVTTYNADVGAAVNSGLGVSNGDLADGFVDGIVFGFDPIGDLPAGYFFTDADLTGGDPELPVNMTDEGGEPAGAYEVLYATSEFLGGDPAFVCPFAQTMLWAPKDAALQGTVSGAVALDGQTAVDDQTLNCDNLGSSDPKDPDALYYSTDEVGNYDFGDFCPNPVAFMVGFYGGGIVGAPGELLDCEISLGNRIGGGECDVFNLVADDDDTEGLNSVPGFFASEPNIAEITIFGNTADGSLTNMAGIITRDSGVLGLDMFAKVKARNFDSGSIEDVGQYDVDDGGVGSDTSHTTPVGGQQYIDTNSDFEVAIRYVSPAVLVAGGFNAFLDQVEVINN